MFSYFEPNFIEKFLWESGFSNFAKIEMTQNKNRLLKYLVAIFKWFNILFNFLFLFFFLILFLIFFLFSIYLFIYLCFCRIMIFYIHAYIVQLSLQTSSGKVVFLGGFHGTPTWALTGVKVTWSLKSVKYILVLQSAPVNPVVHRQEASEQLPG